MKAYVAKVPGVRGFIGTTYCVWKDKRPVKIFLNKKEAYEFANKLNENQEV